MLKSNPPSLKDFIVVTDSDVEVFDTDNKEFCYNKDDKTVQINTKIMSMDLAGMGTT